MSATSKTKKGAAPPPKAEKPKPKAPAKKAEKPKAPAKKAPAPKAEKAKAKPKAVKAEAPAKAAPADDRAIEVIRICANAGRHRIIDALTEDGISVGEVVDIVGKPRPSTSAGLASLRTAGVVEFEKRGKFSFYKLTKAGVRIRGAFADVRSSI
jgi:DNA-binding transcriptional ArsR family regulator